MDPTLQFTPLGLDRALATSDTRRVRRAVLAGVGEARNHPADGDALTDAVALAVKAAIGAAEDANAPDLLASIDMIAMPVGSDDSPDPAGAVRDAMGLTRARTMVGAIGVPQQRLVSNAILAVETGQADAVLVIGAEAKASSLQARRSGLEPPAVPQGPGADHALAPTGEFMAATEVTAMLWDPVTQYALIDSALARIEGRSPVELRQDISELWARFDEVAAGNPDACFAGAPHTATDLATTTEANRLLAYPYNKAHSTQWTLDHSAALLICSEEVAVAHRVPTQQMLHPLVALDSSWGLTLSRRAEPHRWPAMQVMGEVAGDHLDHRVRDVDIMEIYSCFPAAVRVQQRELNLALDGTPTVLGGMAFAGGPFNHFTYMATAAVADRLRRGEGDTAMVTTVSGLLTKGGLMVWGRLPHEAGALVADLAAEVEARTETRDIADFDAQREVEHSDRVVAATVTGGLDPKTFSLVDDHGQRRVISAPAPSGDPAAALSIL